MGIVRGELKNKHKKTVAVLQTVFQRNSYKIILPIK